MSQELKTYSVEEISEIMQLNKRTLYNYIRSGQLKAAKFGKHWRVTHTELQDFMERGAGSPLTKN